MNKKREKKIKNQKYDNNNNNIDKCFERLLKEKNRNLFLVFE
jgi:hypothetical protein